MRKIKEYLLKAWTVGSGLIVISIAFYIFIYIFIKGAPSIDYEFLAGYPKGMPPGSEGGIFPAIMGSLCLTLIAYVFSSMLGISTAVYLQFYCKNKRIAGVSRLIIQCIAGTPSIVIGLFGYTFLVFYLGMGVSLLAGGITLGVMIFPIIEVRAEASFREVDRGLINSSYALGVSKSHTFFKIVMPICIRDIMSAAGIASGYAMGAAAPVMLTASVIYAKAPKSLFNPVMALPNHLHVLVSQGISVENAYGTALVLIFMLLFINILAIFFTRGNKYE